MSGRGLSVDIGKHIECTVAYLKWCPVSRVPETMQACKFTDAISHNPVKQMAVCRAHTKANGWKRKNPLLGSINATLADLSVSSLREPTMATSASAEPVILGRESANIVLFPIPKPKQIQNTASSMQQWQIDKFYATDHAIMRLRG